MGGINHQKLVAFDCYTHIIRKGPSWMLYGALTEDIGIQAAGVHDVPSMFLPRDIKLSVELLIQSKPTDRCELSTVHP